MAEDIKITLETKLKQAKEDVKAIQNAGGLTGPSGAKALNKIQSLFDILSKQDIGKLDADGLKRWLNNFSKLNHYIQSAGRGLSTYSKEYVAQQQKVEQANEKLSKAQDKEAEALKKQEEAFKKYADSRATYYNKATGKQVKDPLKVSSLYEKDQLEIRDSNKEVMKPGAPLDAVKANLDKMVAANKEVKVAQQEVKAAEVTLKTEKLVLENTPSGGSTHPVTSQVDTHTAGNYDLVKGIKENINTQQSQQNADLSEEIGKNVAALNKQSTSLGRAFKQFSIYAIALRTIKKAMSDAVKTIRDLDKYLTEQAMVTGKTRKETYGLLQSYQSMASEIGATTKEIAEVSTQFMRQGKSTADALTLTRAAVQAAKVAGISGAESVNYLTTALNGFQLSAQDAMKVSDKFASIAAQSATSYEEIATALSKVASQANIAGMSIDYTTALLAKGIETTREPAESIGTALKTIIARMRELTDYGKTLEDGMNINNVETQLQYVGIALRNTNGELRSTEDVLDELGHKWDTLSSNQQAAVAKALAGTRQQSRLIAMMNDYERVTELQEIAQRSAGATAAQAATYMEGMEAAINKVNVAWEKIVSAITNSDIIIDLITKVSNAMDHLGAFLQSTGGMIVAMTAIAAIGLTILGRKMMEMQLARQQHQLEIERQKRALDAAKIEAQQYKLTQKQTTEQLRQKAIAAKKAVLKQQELITTKKQKAAEKGIVDATIEQEEAKLNQLQSEYQIAETELAKAEAADYTLNTYEKQNALLQSQSFLTDKMRSGLTMMITPLMTIWGLYKSISTAINTVIARKKAEEVQTKKNTAANTAEAGTSMAGSAGKIPYVGWIIAAGILVAMGIAAGAAIMGLTSKLNNIGANKAADDINKLSNEIYKLQEKANAIKSMEKQYDALDKKIIKTTADQEKMNELLDSTADKLSEDEKETYENLQSTEAKRLFLEKAKNDAITEANKKRREQINILEKLDSTQRKKLLTDQTNADYLQAVDAIYAINNNTLYTYIDSLTSVNDGVEKLTQNILENLSAEQAWDYAHGKSAGAIQKLVDVINDATVTIGEEQIALSEVLDSSKYSLEDKIKAYDDLYTTIQSIGDQTLLSSFEKAYGQWAQLQESMSTTAIQFMDSIGVTIDKLNDFGLALNKLGLTTKEASSRISQLFDLIAGGANVSDSITRLFSDVLSQFAPDSDDYKALYNRILNAYQAATGTGMLNMGQNLTSLRSQINALYEKASKWNQLSLQEQTEFIQDNYDLFKGAGGQELFQAFQTGNYNAIKNALATNEVLKEQIRLRLQQLQIDLGIAEAAEQRNEAEIKWIKDQIKQLEDYQDAAAEIYQADLELRLEQENKQLSLYKTYLEKQKEALEDSLDKRKEAYQKYFDAVNQEQEDQEYYDQAEMLTNNLSKLASSTDAGSRQQAKELEQQLQELEKERLQTLRERAQEAVLNNLDTEVSQINEKFDKLLENQAALLAAMQGDIAADPNGFVNKVLSAGIMNMTATQAEDFIKNDFVPAYNSSISPDTLENIKVRQEGTSLYLTLNNQEVEITQAAQQDLSAAILKALRELGISI